ncbi:alcohol dehydrogenase class-3 chain L-like [Tubulanus polymorphus]|uniref:alcohol dehydrogenase class-3 chain L-like n=1 Tax=Tubulanus polymorphus TaxID=672921 RepID=UPI003DA3A09E
MADTTGKTIECKAAVLWDYNQPYSIETVQVAPPKAGEARVKLIASGVCHSDASVQNGTWSSIGPAPIILGHEGAGVVESVGEGVTSLVPGDHVLTSFLAECNQCPVCENPNANFVCQKIQTTFNQAVLVDGTTRIKCKGKDIRSFTGTSTFSEYAVVPEIKLAKINPEAPLDKVVLLSCGVGTGYGAARKTANVQAGSTCAVWGLGAIGMACVLGCKHAGAAKIYAVDINPDKEKKARAVGATDFINPKDHEKPIQEVLQGLTNGGCHYTFECAGAVVTAQAALEASHPSWGKSVLVGMAPQDKTLSVSPFTLLSGRTWMGSFYGSYKPRTDIPKLVDEYMKGDFPLDEFITHRMPLDKINEAFDFLMTGKSIRTVLEIGKL